MTGSGAQDMIRALQSNGPDESVLSRGGRCRLSSSEQSTLLEAEPSRLDLSECKWKCRAMRSIGSTLDASLKTQLGLGTIQDGLIPFSLSLGASRTKNVLPSAAVKD